MKLSVRELTKADIDSVARYWTESDPDFLVSLGVDLAKLPAAEDFKNMLTRVVEAPIEEKPSYALIWLIDYEPVGHCNVNNIQFGEQAHMHLHMWQSATRKRGFGAQLVKQSVPHFFEALQLNKIVCEPYALNEAPNRTLENVGFVLEQEYTTIPGSINFEQPVKKWVLTRERWNGLRMCV